MPLNQFNKTIDSTFDQLDQGRKNYIFPLVPREIGSVISVSAGIVKVSGLPGVGFEELLKFPGDIFYIHSRETFARFGTRLDEHTRKIIEHGKRIRICLKQHELQPMPVPEQIVILLALTGGLFDSIPINKMQDAEAALQKLNTELPGEILKRLFSDKELNNSDREAILKIAGNTLAPFQDKPDPDQNKK